VPKLAHTILIFARASTVLELPIYCLLINYFIIMEEWQIINAAQTEVQSHKSILDNVNKIVQENRKDEFLAVSLAFVNFVSTVLAL
jgi:hypothetical protein